MTNSCWVCGDLASGNFLYKGGYRNKKANWGYFCVYHWGVLRKLQSDEKKLHSRIEQYDLCYCCDVKSEYEDLQTRRNDFKRECTIPPGSESYL